MKTNLDKLHEICEDLKKHKEPFIILAKEGEEAISSCGCNNMVEIVTLLKMFLENFGKDEQNIILTVLNKHNTATKWQQDAMLEVYKEELLEYICKQKIERENHY
jgi:hypothetical protein